MGLVRTDGYRTMHWLKEEQMWSSQELEFFDELDADIEEMALITFE